MKFILVFESCKLHQISYNKHISVLLVINNYFSRYFRKITTHLITIFVYLNYNIMFYVLRADFKGTTLRKSQNFLLNAHNSEAVAATDLNFGVIILTSSS